MSDYFQVLCFVCYFYGIGNCIFNNVYIVGFSIYGSQVDVVCIIFCVNGLWFCVIVIIIVILLIVSMFVVVVCCGDVKVVEFICYGVIYVIVILRVNVVVVLIFILILDIEREIVY